MTNEQRDFIQAAERLYARAARLRDVAHADDWDKDLEEAVANALLAAASMRNRFEELA